MDSKKQNAKYGTSFTPKKIAEFKVRFDKFDSDGSGHLDKVQFKKALNEANVELTDNQLTDFLRSVDTDKNGVINFNEFTQIMNINEATADGKKMTAEEIVNKNLMRRHEQTQKRRRSVKTGSW